MKRQESKSPIEAEFERLLDVLGSTGKYLERLAVDQGVLDSYMKLLKYLRSRPAAAIPEILGHRASKRSRAAHALRLTEEEIRSMSPNAILGLLADPSTARETLEQVAVMRFGMTAGGLSILRSRTALVAKIRTLVQNEATHESIARLASQTTG